MDEAEERTCKLEDRKCKLLSQRRKRMKKTSELQDIAKQNYIHIMGISE